MLLNKQKVRKLMEIYAGGNYNRFARELGLDPSHLHRFLTTGVGGGKKTIGAVAKYCKEKGVDFQEYIEL